MKRIIYAQDCLDVLNDSTALPDECVDLRAPLFNPKTRIHLFSLLKQFDYSE